MIVNLTDLSKKELIEMNRRAIAQISELIEEKRKLEERVKQLEEPILQLVEEIR